MHDESIRCSGVGERTRTPTPIKGTSPQPGVSANTASYSRGLEAASRRHTTHRAPGATVLTRSRVPAKVPPRASSRRSAGNPADHTSHLKSVRFSCVIPTATNPESLTTKLIICHRSSAPLVGLDPHPDASIG